MSEKPKLQMKREPRLSEAIVRNETNIELSLTTGTTIFGFKAPSPDFVRQLNNLMLILPTLQERLTPTPLPPTGPTEVDSNYAIQGNEVLILASAETGSITLTLPGLATLTGGTRISIIRIDDSVNTITIAAKSGENIEGDATIQLTSLYSKASLVDLLSTWGLSTIL